MSRFFHECFTDPALGAVIAFALIVAVVLTALVVKDKLKRRRSRQRQSHKRGETRERRAKTALAVEGSN